MASGDSMELRSFCALPAALLRFRPQDGQSAIAVICKATYRLVPGPAPLAPEQVPLQNGEYHYNNDPMQSVSLEAKTKDIISAIESLRPFGNKMISYASHSV